TVTGVQTCALPIYSEGRRPGGDSSRDYPAFRASPGPEVQSSKKERAAKTAALRMLTRARRACQASTVYTQMAIQKSQKCESFARCFKLGTSSNSARKRNGECGTRTHEAVASPRA